MSPDEAAHDAFDYFHPMKDPGMNHEDSVKDSLRSPVIPQKEFKSLLDSEKSGALLKIRPKRLISHSDPPNLIGGRGPAKPGLEAFVQCREAANFLGLHCKTVERYARQGLLPAHPATGRHRRRRRFLISELDVWLRSRVISACHPCSPEK
jgi:excisionase family DNA binding protein